MIYLKLFLTFLEGIRPCIVAMILLSAFLGIVLYS